MFTKIRIVGVLLFLPVLSLGCSLLEANPKPAAVATEAVDLTRELCTLDLSALPKVKAAAAKVPEEVGEYAWKVCGFAKVAEPYARLLGENSDTGALVSPIEEARQRALEQAAGLGKL